jgi:hypothetical protein
MPDQNREPVKGQPMQPVNSAVNSAADSAADSVTDSSVTSPAFEVSVEFAGAPECGARLLAFTLGSRGVQVRQMIDRWYGTDYCYLKLEGEDVAIYILRHDERTDCWAMTLFQTDPQQAQPIGPRHPPQPMLS